MKKKKLSAKGMENYTARSVTMRTVHNTVRIIVSITIRKGKNKSDFGKKSTSGEKPFGSS
jgi:hypothetical protein